MNIHLKGLAMLVGSLFALWLTTIYVRNVDVRDARAEVLFVDEEGNAPGVEGTSATLTAEELLSLQVLLDASGIDPGPVDGLMGPSTATAIEQGKVLVGLDEEATTRDLLKALQGVQDAFLSNIVDEADGG